MAIIPTEAKQTIVNGRLSELYDQLRLVAQSHDDAYESLLLVKFGIKLKFDIKDLLYDNYVVKNKAEEVLIGDKSYDLHQFWEEIEQREDIARGVLYKYMEDPEAIKPWTSK